jgi:hypothetical protein
VRQAGATTTTATNPTVLTIRNHYYQHAGSSWRSVAIVGADAINHLITWGTLDLFFDQVTTPQLKGAHLRGEMVNYGCSRKRKIINKGREDPCRKTDVGRRFSCALPVIFGVTEPV